MSLQRPRFPAFAEVIPPSFLFIPVYYPGNGRTGASPMLPPVP